MRHVRRHLTFANVASGLALFLVLTGGTAMALQGHNTVFSDDIVNGQVKEADVAEPPWQVVANNPQTVSDPCASGKTKVFCGIDNSPAEGYCYWQNWEPSDYQRARFYRDAEGEVHIQGLVQLVLPAAVNCVT